MRPQGFANSKLTKTMEKTDIGLIGLAVMGENLALNMESKGFSVSVYNRTAPGEKGVVDRFVAGRGNGKRFTGTHSIRELVGSVRRPRRIMMMVRAGEAVDELIAQLTPLMEPGDVIIDGGNSAFQDTARRVKEVENRGLYFVGAGISGGEEGALHGPSIMPGGTPEAWPLVKDVLQGIAAKLDDGTPCCEWIGSGGAGHFVKTVHNGIPYTGEAPAKAEPDKPESHPEPAVPANDADVDAMKQDIVDRTNALRKENGIAALTADDKLMQAAQVRAEEMAASGVYSHIRPDGRKYMTVTDSQYIGENIHCLEDWALKEKSLPETVMWAWSASAGHLKNMTNSRYGSIGVGLAKGTDENGEDCWYCVQLFMDTGCSISWVDRPAVKQ